MSTTTYEAPLLTVYGSVAAITSSAKCSPGADAQLSGKGASASSTSSTGAPYDDGVTMFYSSQNPGPFGQVPSGTQCWNTSDGSPFTAG